MWAVEYSDCASNYDGIETCNFIIMLHLDELYVKGLYI